MAVYNTGSVNIKIGSSEIVGNNTEFTTYVSKGYLFKRTSDSTFYEIAAVNSATNLDLTARYLDSDYYNSQADEAIATLLASTKMYSGTLTYSPIIQSSVSINASIEIFTDNGGGTLTGDGTPAGSGTIDYDTGVWSVTLGTDITATYSMTASYTNGNTLNAMSYQIVKDYTPHRKFPEASTSDANLAYIYTKGVRMIDSAFMKEKVRIVSADYTASSTDKNIIASNTTTKITITLPPSSTNVGRVIHIYNLSSSSLVATPYATPTKINDVTSTLLPNRWDHRKMLCASSNLWLIIP